MSSSARDAYIAGFSGAPKYKGSTKNKSFKAGQDSRKVFNRRSKYKNWGDRKYQTGAGKRWDEKIGDFFRDKTSQGIGAFQAGMKAGKELFLDPMMKAAENKKILGELYEDKDQREQIKRSLMTPEAEAFEKKYLELARLAPTAEKRQEYLDVAETARRNAQISSRLNYGLGQLGYDTIGKEGFASYQPDFTGGEGTGFAEGSSPRFNLDNFLGGLRATKAGKDFYNAALATQANEPGGNLISDAIINYGDAAEGRGGRVTPEMLESTPFAYPETDISGGEQTIFKFPYGQLGDPDVSAEGEEFLTPTPFNAADTYSNLNFPFIRNKIFPGINLADITQQNLDDLSMEDRIYLGYTG